MIFLFLLAVSIWPSPAQQSSGISPEKGLTLGNVIFFPSVLFGYEYNDNVFSRNEQFAELFGFEKVSDNIYTIKPTFRFELPFSHSYARLSYTPQYRSFADYDLAENISHILNLDTLLMFSNGMRVSFKEDYTKGILEVESFDPGGETVFGADQFRLSTSTLGFGYDFAGQRGFEIKANYDDLKFDRLAVSSFFNYDAKGARASYYQNLTPQLTIFSNYSFRTFTQGIPVYNALGEMIRTKEEEFDENIVAVGLKGNLLKKTTGFASISYSNLSFKGGVEASDFAGITAEASLKTQLSSKFWIDFGLRRYAYQSYFLNNKYYLSNMGSFGLIQYIAKFTSVSIRGSYSLNRYPDPVEASLTSIMSAYNGITREDKMSRIDLGVNHLFTPTMGLRAGYSWIKRDTNIDIYGFDANRFFIQMGFGWF
ncbi:MAG: hypothetical protein AB1756_06745 [Acidobacteriota bacterium]